MRLLLVEDDLSLGDGLSVALRQQGYAVDWVKDGLEAEVALGIEPYEMVVLDVGLPGQSGFELLDKTRSRGSDVPIIVLTARDLPEDRISGLNKGADDYMIKPFNSEELFARIRTIQRRMHGRSISAIRHTDSTIGELVVDVSGRVVTLNDEVVDLSAKEFAVLRQLLENKGRVLSKVQLEEAIYDWENELESNAVEVYVHYLRRKLGKSLIRTLRGVGYVIDKSNT